MNRRITLRERHKKGDEKVEAELKEWEGKDTSKMNKMDKRNVEINITKLKNKKKKAGGHEDQIKNWESVVKQLRQALHAHKVRLGEVSERPQVVSSK